MNRETRQVDRTWVNSLRKVPDRRIGWFLFLVALAPRLWALGRAGLWQDEMIFVSILSTPGAEFGEVFRRYWDYVVSMGQMPLTGLVQNRYIAALHALGMEDAVCRPGWMRLPMALLGAAAVPGIYLAARRYAGRAESLMAALWMTFAFYPVFYSREAYCYAAVICFSAWGLNFWFRYDEQRGWPSFIGATLCFTGMAWSHLGAIVVLGAWVAATVIRSLLAWGMRQPRSRVVRSLWAAAPPAIAAALASPWLIYFMRHNTAHIGSGTGVAPWQIVHDAVNKMFLGEWTPLALLAWLFLLSGVWTGLRRLSADPWERRFWMTLAAGTGLILLTIATLRTQYISARYFSPLITLVVLLISGGIHACGVALSKRIPLCANAGPGWVSGTLAGLLLLPHLLFYLPVYWRMDERHEDFHGVARWLNEHLEPGSIYLLESAYPYRFVGGYYPTPGLIPAAPYVHGHGPDELRRLQQRQKDFIRRFPESPLITLGHPGWDHPDQPWQWPQTYFQRRTIIGNEPLRQLIQMGIYPGVPNESLDDTTYRMIIHYDTPADRRARVMASGADVLFDYPQWTVQAQPVSPQENRYFRIVRGTRGSIVVENPHANDVSGQLRLHLVWWTDRGPSRARILVGLQEKPLYSGIHLAGQGFEVVLDDLRWTPGTHTLALHVSGAPETGTGLALMDLYWQPDLTVKNDH